eukprot:scaffold30763_cov76-Phaeocystis_antarctica.AAC.2
MLAARSGAGDRSAGASVQASTVSTAGAAGTAGTSIATGVAGDSSVGDAACCWDSAAETGRAL